MDLTSIRERVLIDVLRWTPKGTLSRLLGYCARRPIPRRLRRPLFTAFARRVGADLGEVELPLHDYASLDAFFTRGLRPGARPIPSDGATVISPCDGTVSAIGVAEGGHLIQAKGKAYTLADLLADDAAAARFAGGPYVTIYLSPRDYHRVHFAVDGPVTGFQHVPGTCFPVNAAAVKHVDRLFARNERLVTYQDTGGGEIATVMVAATGVGHMTVTYDAVETHMPRRGRPGPRVRFAAGRAARRGDELGAFHLGSTVILLFEPGRVRLRPLEPGARIRLGDPLGERASARRTHRGDAAA